MHHDCRVVAKFKGKEKKMCTKMFSSGSGTELKPDSGDEDEEVLSESKLAEYRMLYHNKFG